MATPAPPQLAELFQLGLTLHQLGRLDQARALYRAVLLAQPQHFDALHLTGLVHHQTEKHQLAAQVIAQAIAIHPGYAPAHYNLAGALKALGRLDEAVASLDRAVSLQPDYADAWYNRGIALKALGRLDQAVASYDQAIRIAPGHAQACCNRAAVLQESQQLDAAAAGYAQAIRINPDYADAHSNLGVVQHALDRLDDALASHDRAIGIAPEFAEAHANRGNALKALGRLDEALASYDRAVGIRPDYAEAWYNRGLALKAHLQLPDAVASYDQALRIRPAYAEAGWNKSLALLLGGEFLEGWALYEWRWKNESGASFQHRRDFAQPPWLGAEPLVGKTILLHSEQGLGDTLQFCRYAGLVAALGARVVLQVQRPLLPLLADLGGVHQLVAQGDALPAVDCHCPLMSLPLAFKTTLASVPMSVPYLRVAEDRLARWRDHLGDEGFKIAVAWQGNAAGKVDLGRSFPAGHFDAISRMTGVRLISLQKNAGVEQLARLPPGMVLETLPDHFDGGDGAFLDSAAVMCSVDLVITSDTALTHLAGALGVRTWLPLKFAPDWRWLLDRHDSPWYPNHRLFRQMRSGDWDAVFKAMANELGPLRSAKLDGMHLPGGHAR